MHCHKIRMLIFLTLSQHKDLCRYVLPCHKIMTYADIASLVNHMNYIFSGSAFEQAKKFKIVRQSQPYGSLSGESGLFFIAFSESPENFEYMLDRMVGKDADGHSDDIMRITQCVKSTYFYFPGVAELNKLK